MSHSDASFNSLPLLVPLHLPSKTGVPCCLMEGPALVEGSMIKMSLPVALPKHANPFGYRKAMSMLDCMNTIFNPFKMMVPSTVLTQQKGRTMELACGFQFNRKEQHFWLLLWFSGAKCKQSGLILWI